MRSPTPDRPQAKPQVLRKTMSTDVLGQGGSRDALPRADEVAEPPAEAAAAEAIAEADAPPVAEPPAAEAAVAE